MCYESYERLLRERAARRAAERPASTERAAPKPAVREAPAAPAQAGAREKEPA